MDVLGLLHTWTPKSWKKADAFWFPLTRGEEKELYQHFINSQEGNTMGSTLFKFQAVVIFIFCINQDPAAVWQVMSRDRDLFVYGI